MNFFLVFFGIFSQCHLFNSTVLSHLSSDLSRTLFKIKGDIYSRSKLFWVWLGSKTRGRTQSPKTQSLKFPTQNSAQTRAFGLASKNQEKTQPKAHPWSWTRRAWAGENRRKIASALKLGPIPPSEKPTALQPQKLSSKYAKILLFLRYSKNIITWAIPIRPRIWNQLPIRLDTLFPITYRL